MGTNDFITKGMEMQKSMFDYWTKSYQDFIGGAMKGESADSKNPYDFNAFFQNANDSYKNFMNTWQDAMKNFPGMAGIQMPDQQELFQKIFNSSNVYQKLFELWNDFAQQAPFDTPEKISDFVKTSQEKYVDVMKQSFMPLMPEMLQNNFEELVNLSDQWKNLGENFLQPWSDSTGSFQASFQKMMSGNPDAYMDFYKTVSENYKESFGKLFDAPSVGLNKEIIEKQLTGIDSFFEFINSFNSLYAIMYKTSVETMQALATSYQDRYAKGEAPKTFKEFYEMWWRTNEDAFIKLFSTQEFSRMFCEFAAKYSEFKLQYDKILELQLKALPLPSRTDMDSLYKTVYDQTKELKSLKKEIKELKDLVGKLQAAASAPAK